MALIICRKCGNRVSTTAIKCPRCGTPPYTRNPAPQEIQHVNAPTQPGLKPQPEARPPILNLEEVVRRIRDLRLDQFTPRQIAVGLGAFVVAWCVFISIPRSPSYAIYTFYRNVNAHKGEAAANFIDFPSLTKTMSNDAMKTASESKESDPSAEVLARGFMSLMSGPIADTLKSRFEQMVEAPSGKDQFTMGFGDLLSVLWHLERDGDTAISHLKDRQGKDVDVTLSREDSGWRVIGVGGPGFQTLVRERLDRKNGGNLPNPLHPKDDNDKGV